MILANRLKAGNNTVPDVNLSGSEYTEVLAGDKGWVASGTYTWYTTYITLNTLSSDAAAYGRIINTGLIIPNRQVTLSARRVTGTTGCSLKIEAYNSSAVLLASDTATSLGEVASITFTPNTFTTELRIYADSFLSTRFINVDSVQLVAS